MTDLSPAEASAMLNDLRNRVINGEEVSDEEYRQVIDSIRIARGASPAGKPKAKGKSTPIALTDLED